MFELYRARISMNRANMSLYEEEAQSYSYEPFHVISLSKQMLHRFKHINGDDVICKRRLHNGSEIPNYAVKCMLSLILLPHLNFCFVFVDLLLTNWLTWLICCSSLATSNQLHTLHAIYSNWHQWLIVFNKTAFQFIFSSSDQISKHFYSFILYYRFSLRVILYGLGIGYYCIFSAEY